MTEQLECPYYLDWIKVPHLSCIMKFSFHEEYAVLLSNFMYVYGEKLEGQEAVNRFNEKNPLVEINPVVLFKHLKRAIECTLEKNEYFKLSLEGDKLVLSLQFAVMQVLCEYDVILSILPQKEMLSLIIAPILFNSCLSYLSCIEFKEKLQGAKDRIHDVKHSANTMASVASNSSMISPTYDSSDSEISRIKEFKLSMMSSDEVTFPRLVQAFVDVQQQQKTLLAENMGFLKHFRFEVPIPETFIHHENSLSPVTDTSQLQKPATDVEISSHSRRIGESDKSVNCAEPLPSTQREDGIHARKSEKSHEKEADSPASCEQKVKHAKKKMKCFRV